MLSLWSCSSRKWSICINSYWIRHFFFWEYQKDPQFVKLQMFRRERVQELRSLLNAGGALCFALLAYCSKKPLSHKPEKKTNPAKKKLKILVRFPFWFNGVGLLSCVLPPHVNFQDKTVQSSRTENVNSEQTAVKCKKKSRNVKYIVAEIINEEGVRVNKAISVSGEI